MAESISSLIVTVRTLQAIYKTASWAYGKLNEQTPVKNAIAATAADYPNISSIESALKKLIESDEFSRELERAEIGDKVAADEEVADLLVDKCSFFTGIDRSHRDALEVVKAFLRHLEEEMLRSLDAHLYTERRAEIRHQETIEAIHQTQPRISAASEAEIKELVERTRKATSELTANSLANRRLAGQPQIALQTVKLERESKEAGKILNLNSIRSLLMEGSRLLIEAPAGRGKSTTLVQLAKQDGGITFLIDLPTWVRTRQNILDFIACKPAFQSRGINAEILARLSEVEQFLFLLNGWNEVSETNSDDAAVALRELEQDFPKAGVIVATRTHHIIPPLTEVMRAKLLPLNKTQRTQYLQKRLESRADELISRLDGNPVLDDLTQTFLFLAEVATIFESGRPIPPTKMGVLGEVINLLEQSEEHSSHLQRPPLKGRTSEYLEGLATQMTTQGAARVLSTGQKMS